MSYINPISTDSCRNKTGHQFLGWWHIATIDIFEKSKMAAGDHHENGLCCIFGCHRNRKSCYALIMLIWGWRIHFWSLFKVEYMFYVNKINMADSAIYKISIFAGCDFKQAILMPYIYPIPIDFCRTRARHQFLGW